jgi:Arc/MetJ-type ribon-helix-helix transcriptional regulator
MAEKKYDTNVGISLPKPFMGMIDEIVEKNPDFKNRMAVIRYAVRKYYEFLKGLKKV